MSDGLPDPFRADPQAAAGAAAAGRPSRRGFLAGGAAAGALVVGAGAGVGVEYWRDRPPAPAAPRRPAVLLAALAAERALIERLDSALAHSADATLRRVRDEHAAHEQALAAAVAQAGGDAAATTTTPTTAPSAGGSTPAATPTSAPPPDRPALRRAEAAAARAAAGHAARLRGRDAALLASISASEASHAELLA